MSGASWRSSSLTRWGLIAACGQTNAHWLHWIHFSLFQHGNSVATPLFSNLAVLVGTIPLGSKELTGRSFPSSLEIGLIIFSAFSF